MQVQVLRVQVLRFLSTIPARLDGKGRVSLPAPFRAVLEADGYPGLVMHPALDPPALEAGGNRLLAGIDGLLGRYPPYSEARDLIATALLGASEHLRPAPGGRIVLPERFKAHAGITAQVVFVGLGDRFRLFSPEGFVAQEAEAKARSRAPKASLAQGTGKGAA